MATTMIYDTLKLAEQLEHEAGFDASRARAMARILAENTGGNLATREDIKELATKGDLLAAKAELRDEIHGVRDGLRDEIHSVRDGLREEIHSVRDGLREEIHSVRDGLREEIHGVRDSLREEIHGVRDGLREEIHGVRDSLKGEIQEMRGDIRVLYWMSGTTLAGVAALLSIAITVALHVMRLG